MAPSAVPDVASREVPKVMELADIQAVIEGFALGARHAMRGGADGIELQIADRSLLRQFLSPLTNQRSDQNGGSLENRLRFVHETIEAVDAALGTSRILGVRLCADELAPWAGIIPEQGIEIARLLVATERIDYLSATLINNYTGQPRQVEQMALAVMATPQTAHDTLYHQLQGKVKHLYRVGDCVAPRRVEHAILDGERVARSLPTP